MRSNSQIKGAAAISLCIAAVLVAIGGIAYILSWKLIYAEVRQTAAAPYKTDFAGSGYFVQTRENSVLLADRRERTSAIVRGHSSAVLTARFTRDGQSVLSTDADGIVRLSSVRFAKRQHAVTELPLMESLRERAWSVYGENLAELSLDAISALFPLRFRDCPTCPEMIVVPDGSFLTTATRDSKAGATGDQPQKSVEIARPFAVGRYEIMLGEYAEFVSETGWAGKNDCQAESAAANATRPTGRSWRAVTFDQTEANPVLCVNWADANEYANWLSRKTGQQYRLLTEDEWEYAAHADDATTNGKVNAATIECGDGDRPVTPSAEGPSGATPECADADRHTVQVGLDSVNAFGLHDMFGNVTEWVEDCYQNDGGRPPLDGADLPPHDCPDRVARGGSWAVPQASRRKVSVDYQGETIGFRVARVIGSAPPKLQAAAFLTHLVVTPLGDGNQIRLLEPLVFRDRSGTIWTVPAGTIADGVSIPRVFWSVIGGPFEGNLRSAAVLHDYFSSIRNRPYGEVNKMFYDAMAASGTDRSRAWLIYQAVARFGPRWDVSTPSR